MLFFQIILLIVTLATCFLKAGTNKLLLLTAQVILAFGIGIVALFCGQWFLGSINIGIMVIAILNMFITKECM
jgi:hypothetical protein